MKLTPLQKRAERKARNQTQMDMNLVSLIDVFTILIFFLMSSSGVEVLPSPKAVTLPESVAETAPKETVVVVISGSEILVDGRVVATVADVMRLDGDLIAPLKAELEHLQATRPVALKANEAQARQLTIMGDKDIPYQLLRKVMATGASANFQDVSFAVRQRAES